tara:strand:+ start:939 stop:1220 length:282 start_codon:yes stop_codon:yes gene_type:complete
MESTEREQSLHAQAEWLAANIPSSEKTHLKCDHVPEAIRETFLLAQLGPIIRRMTTPMRRAWDLKELDSTFSPDLKTQKNRHDMAVRVLRLLN